MLPQEPESSRLPASRGAAAVPAPCLLANPPPPPSLLRWRIRLRALGASPGVGARPGPCRRRGELMVACKGRAGQGSWELGGAVRDTLEAWAAELAKGSRVCRVRLGQLQLVLLALARALRPGQDGAPPPSRARLRRSGRGPAACALLGGGCCDGEAAVLPEPRSLSHLRHLDLGSRRAGRCCACSSPAREQNPQLLQPVTLAASSSQESGSPSQA